MSGHALALAPRPATRRAWDVAIALGFAIGSLCFFIGPFPGFVQLVGPGADGVVFFVGSIFFTFAASLELREVTVRRGRRWGRDATWWSAFVQFAGTLLFNVSTFDAMQDGLSTHQENRLVWTPDLFGSACFLASGALAYRVATGPSSSPPAGTGRGGSPRSTSWAACSSASRPWPPTSCPRAGRCSTSPPRTGPPRWARSASSSVP
jgi:hypothetical protein